MVDLLLRGSGDDNGRIVDFPIISKACLDFNSMKRKVSNLMEQHIR